MRNSPRPKFPLHQTLHLAVCIRAGSILLASSEPRFVSLTDRLWRVIPHSREHVSTAPESNGGELYTTPADAWPSNWKPISWSYWNSASRDRLELGSECWNWRQTIITSYALQWSCSVSLSCLPLRSWAVIAHRCFHFTITALTVDRRSASRAEMLQTDLLEKWHPMTVPRWKSLSSSVRPFYCQCLSMAVV